jgi:hypothetical protein
MEYFILQGHWEKGDLHAEDFKFPAYFQDCFWGRPLPEKRQRAMIVCRNPTDRITDLVHGLFDFVIVTKQFEKIFADLEPKNTQFHDVEIVTRRKTIATVCFVNILNNIDGLNRQRSDIEVDPDDEAIIVSFRRAVLRPEAVRGRHAFRIQGLEEHVVVTETFKSAVTSAELSGVRFLKLSEYKSA